MTLRIALGSIILLHQVCPHSVLCHPYLIVSEIQTASQIFSILEMAFVVNVVATQVQTPPSASKTK
jgi:hypothetical protein